MSKPVFYKDSDKLAGMSSELEQTLSLLASHKSVLGYLLATRPSRGKDKDKETHTSASIIRQSGTVFEGEHGRKYAGAIAKMLESVQKNLDDLHHTSSDSSNSEFVDDVKFLRIRTKRHEIMISPDDHYILAVVNDPST